MATPLASRSAPGSAPSAKAKAPEAPAPASQTRPATTSAQASGGRRNDSSMATSVGAEVTLRVPPTIGADVPFLLSLAVLGASLAAEIDSRASAVEPQVIASRRDLHAHPELSNREERTARVVAEALEKMGLEVRTGIAKTGVLGVLRGGKPGPVVALRADMDALPLTEETGLPFASKARASYGGQRSA